MFDVTRSAVYRADVATGTALVGFNARLAMEHTRTS
jgi:hypothetical protein